MTTTPSTASAPLDTGLRLRAVKRPRDLEPHAEPPSFDPWRFGTLRIPRDLRQELLLTKLPEIPAERLYASPSVTPAVPTPPRARFAGAARLLVLGSAVIALLAALARFWSLK